VHGFADTLARPGPRVDEGALGPGGRALLGRVAALLTNAKVPSPRSARCHAMFIPLYDVNPTRQVPVVNFVLLGVNAAVWMLELVLTNVWAPGVVTAGYGLVPARLMADPTGELFTVFSSMFMHGSWAHVGGNMLFLYIFGDNVEEALGHGRYALFYLLCGVAAAVAQVLVDPFSHMAMVGASGAIAGILGAYLVLHPRAPIVMLNTVLPLWLLLGVTVVFPAWLAIGMWFLLNIFGGLGSLGMGFGDGVAYFAHVGGFVTGLVLIRPWMSGRSRPDAAAWAGWHLAPRKSPSSSDWPPGGRRNDPWSPHDPRG
jgi:membrane associated rhomboid family serine protease